jgi:hypothetical protein
MAGLNKGKLIRDRICFRQLFMGVFGMMVIMLCIVNTLLRAEMQKNENLKAVFETKYKAWKDYCSQPSISLSSNTTPYINNNPYREMIKLGIPALPYMMEKIGSDPSGHFLCAVMPHNLKTAVPMITKKKFHITQTGQKPGEFRWSVEEFPDMKELDKPPVGYKLWLRWWKEGATCTSQQFEKFYREWKDFSQEGTQTEAKAKYQRMIELGVAALPYMIEKVGQGDVELVPAISELTDSKVNKDAKPTECLNWWKENKEKWIISFPEVEPQTSAKN